MVKKSVLIIVSIISAFIIFLVYAPHINYTLPYHIDEWHHISEASKLRVGEYSSGFKGFEFGFHIFLASPSYLFDLVLIYKSLPALWAAIYEENYYIYKVK